MTKKELADRIKRNMQELLDLTAQEQITQTINHEADVLWNQIVDDLQKLGGKDE